MNQILETTMSSLIRYACTSRASIVLTGIIAFYTTEFAMSQSGSERMRAREAGVVVGIFEPGPLNAITDVSGVRVGQVTMIEGDSIRTGITAIIPHPGNVFFEPVPAAIHVANGFGKLLGATQVNELGEIETPILLTCTLCVWKAADAMIDFLISQPDMAEVRSINPVVGETNDGYLNDIRARSIQPDHVRRALTIASSGPVAEGSVGAGTGTMAFGWKGGIGTSSRRTPDHLGGYTIGVLVQSNFGGILTINGAPVGRELGKFPFKNDVGENADGSIMIVVATDAPLQSHALERLAKRAIVGLSRTGAMMSNGSGDYVIAFSTYTKSQSEQSGSPVIVSHEALSPLFQAVAEATEEAIYNSLFKAVTMEGNGHLVEALPSDRVLEILTEYNVLQRDHTPPEK